MKIGIQILLLITFLQVKGQVVINEVCQNNADIIYDSTFFNFPSWVELYNLDNESVDLSGHFLSDSISKPQKWAFPAGSVIAANGYLLVWLDELNVQRHTNFSIEPEGGTVVLSSSVGTMLDQVTFPIQYPNTSFGREPNGSATWIQSSEPSPLKPNVGGRANGPLPKVEFNMPSGRYAGTLSVSLTQLQNSSEIHYTIDGSEPTQKSTLFNSAFDVSQTAVVKAKAFHPDFLPSETSSVTYFINEHEFTLPVVSLSTDPKYLWNDTIGIYVEGINGFIGNCSTIPVNWNQDWDRHGVFELMNSTGTVEYQQHLTFRVAGKCSRRRDQKSFALKARREFGSGKISYPLFNNKPIKKYDEFFLRNSGQDFNVTHFRDALMQTLPIGMMDIDYMSYQPSILYLNGEYWGIQNLREKIDGDFIENNYGIPDTDIDLILNNTPLIGTNDAWTTYLDSLYLLDPLDPKAFPFMQRHIDVQEYVNFLVMQVYYGNADWPGNTKFWRQRSTNGKFRWFIYDTDFGFALFPNRSTAQHPTLDFATTTLPPVEPNNNTQTFTKPIRSALAVPEFRDHFIATMATAMGTTFSPDRVVGMINQFQDRIKAEMPHHKLRWGGTMANWESEVQELRDFALARNGFMQNHVGSFFNLEQVSLSTSVSPPLTGRVEVNGITTEGIFFAPYYQGVGLKLKALPNPGFQFKHWSISESEGKAFNAAATGDVWKYWDQGNLPGANWKDTSFVDATWKSGASPLGYGDPSRQTTIVCANASQCLPTPSPTPTGNKFITTYFRRSFNIADTSKIFNLNANVLYDDGVVVYLNGTEIYRGNMPTGSIGFSTLASASKTIETEIHVISVNKNILRNGKNTISAEVHQNLASSGDLSFDLNFFMFEIGDPETGLYFNPVVIDTAFSSVEAIVTYEPVPQISGLVINEISATNTNTLDNEGQAEDWIELYNAGNATINLDGLYLSNEPNKKGKFKLTAGASDWTLAPGAYQVLWADDDEIQGRNHLSYKLSSLGDTIMVNQMVGFDTVKIAKVIFSRQPKGFSLARIPNATGDFQNTFLKTPGATNAQVPIVQGLVINEFSARPSTYVDAQGHQDDWIELFNAGTNPIDLNGLFVTDTIGNKLKDRLDANGQPWILQPGAFQILWADTSTLVGPDHLSFRLSGSGEAVGLFQVTNGDTVQLDFFGYGDQMSSFSSARIPNGTGPFVFTSKLTPGAANQEPAPIVDLVLNEFSASDDWIELFNKGAAPIELSGLFITDDPTNKQKHLLTKVGTSWVLAPGGYELLFSDNLPAQGSEHLSFGLSSSGDEIAMYQLIGGNLVELFMKSYTAQTPLYSMARMPNGTGPFVLNSNKTPKAENTGVITSVDEWADKKTLYPNPAKTEFKILLKEQNASISIHDQFGRKLHSYSLTGPTDEPTTIGVSEYANGFYYVRIVYPSETITVPLIVSH